MSIVNMRAAAVFLVAIFCVEALSASRITPPGNAKALRCKPEELKLAECEDDRRYAIAQGCINHQELQELIKYEGCPVCMRGDYRGWCPIGCFIRGTKLLVLDSFTSKEIWTPVEDIVQTPSRYRIISLNKDATRSALKFIDLPIRLTVLGPEKKPLVVLTTRDQRTLGLSSEHAVVLSNGKLVKAEALQVGDLLISADGNEDVIVEISRPHTDDDVFNVSVETDFDQSHLILAEGLLVGDQFLQGKNRNATILNP